MITKEEFLLQNLQIELQAQDDAYQAYCNQIIANELKQSRIQRILTAVNTDWEVIAELHPMVTSDFKKEFEEVVDEELALKIEQDAAALIAKKAQDKLNADSLKFLAETDFYIIRELDNGVACPQDIKDARAAARLAIVK